jgi:hypothetical protein
MTKILAGITLNQAMNVSQSIAPGISVAGFGFNGFSLENLFASYDY